MARLILEEGDARRAFKVGEGRLTIGSGANCSLRLVSEGVAEVHAELEVSGGFAYLRPRPGVMPPLMHGQPVTHQVPLAHDARFEIGAARFHYLAEEQAAASAGAPRAQPPAPKPAAAPRPAPSRSAAPQRAAASAQRPVASAQAAASAAGVQRNRPRAQVKRGIPTWLMLVLIGGALILTFFALRALVGQTGKSTVVPEATLARARERFEQREFDAARAALALIPREQVSAALRKQIETLESEMDAIDRDLVLDREHRREAEDYRTTQLEGFMKARLVGDNPPRERVRVFLKRLREFRQRWPQFPDMDWIDRHERLYSRLVDLNDPPTFKDVAYEVETLTWAKPRDYRQAAGIVRAFAERASGADREQAIELLDQLAAAEKEFFDDQMQQAKYHWQRKESGKAVGVLISLVLGLDVPEHVDQAARELVGLPGIEDFLRSYRRTSSKYPELILNPRVREVAQRAGLL